EGEGAARQGDAAGHVEGRHAGDHGRAAGQLRVIAVEPERERLGEVDDGEVPRVVHRGRARDLAGAGDDGSGPDLDVAHDVVGEEEVVGPAAEDDRLVPVAGDVVGLALLQPADGDGAGQGLDEDALAGVVGDRVPRHEHVVRGILDAYAVAGV